MVDYINALDWLSANLLDEDDMVSNSDTLPSTQQAIKVYTDTGVQEAKDYADTQIAAGGFATEAYADQAEADAITTSNAYTDTAVGDIVVTNGYLEWDATVYDIAYQPAITLTVAPLINGADWGSLADNGSGSTGVACLTFEGTAVESALGAWTPPKTWRAATNIIPVVRFLVKSAGTGGQRVAWGLEYTITDTGDTIGNTSIISAVTPAPADTDYAAGKVYAVQFPAINMASYTLGSEPTITYRLFRDADSTYNTDDYPNNAFMIDFDFIFQVFRNGCEASEL